MSTQIYIPPQTNGNTEANNSTHHNIKLHTMNANAHVNQYVYTSKMNIYPGILKEINVKFQKNAITHTYINQINGNAEANSSTHHSIKLHTINVNAHVKHMPICLCQKWTYVLKEITVKWQTNASTHIYQSNKWQRRSKYNCSSTHRKIKVYKINAKCQRVCAHHTRQTYYIPQQKLVNLSVTTPRRQWHRDQTRTFMPFANCLLPGLPREAFVRGSYYEQAKNWKCDSFFSPRGYKRTYTVIWGSG